MNRSETRQLIVCCDGTNNTLTGGKKDTNVVKLCALFANAPSAASVERIVFYDPGVGNPGTMPETTGWDNFKRGVRRVAALAFGRGVYENIAEGYRFLMRNYRPGDQIFIFGFSRGAFTARCISGIVNLFGVLRPDMDSMLSSVLHIYFAQYESGKASPPANARIYRPSAKTDWTNPNDLRANDAAQVSELFADPACREVDIHFVGVWDTVASVGMWPFQAKFHTAPTVAKKHFLNVRHALALDEHRAQFEPRLYKDDNGTHVGFGGKPVTLEQRWFRGAHCDIGGGYENGDAKLSDKAFAWVVSEAVQCGLDLSDHVGPLDTEARVLAALETLTPYRAASETIVHSELFNTAFWAATGLHVRRTHYDRAASHDGDKSAKKKEARWPRRTELHPSVSELDALFPRDSVWGRPRKEPLKHWLCIGAVSLAAVVLFLLQGQLHSSHVHGQNLLHDISALWSNTSAYAALNAKFAWWQLTSLFTFEPLKFETNAAPRWALIWDCLFALCVAYLLSVFAAWQFDRSAGFRGIDTRVPVWRNHLAWGLPIYLLADLGENIASWITLTFVDFGKPVFSIFSSVPMTLLSIGKWFGLVAFVFFCVATMKRDRT